MKVRCLNNSPTLKNGRNLLRARFIHPSNSGEDFLQAANILSEIKTDLFISLYQMELFKEFFKLVFHHGK